jgi:hypothetical protein
MEPAKTGRMIWPWNLLTQVDLVQQWNQPRIGWMNQDSVHPRADRLEAAMEPAKDRLDDLVRRRPFFAPLKPQLSRQGTGRMTTSPNFACQFSTPPQWSRPRIGRTTGTCRSRSRPGGCRNGADRGTAARPAGESPTLPHSCTSSQTPQWSRPGTGRTTCCLISPEGACGTRCNGADRGPAG